MERRKRNDVEWKRTQIPSMSWRTCKISRIFWARKKSQKIEKSLIHDDFVWSILEFAWFFIFFDIMYAPPVSNGPISWPHLTIFPHFSEIFSNLTQSGYFYDQGLKRQWSLSTFWWKHEKLEQSSGHFDQAIECMRTKQEKQLCRMFFGIMRRL